MKNQFYLLDRYFLSVPTLIVLNKLNEENGNLPQIVTKAKKFCIAYEQPREYSGQRIISTLNVIEMYVMCSSIAIGLLQIIALRFSSTELNNKFFRYLRTPSKEIVSEAKVASYLHKNIFCIMCKNADLSITKIIKNKLVN